MSITRQDAINDALERLRSLGFTMENAFSEHGPMVAEAISTLGGNEEVAGWVEVYKQKHQHAPLLRERRESTDRTKPGGAALSATFLVRRIGSSLSASN